MTRTRKFRRSMKRRAKRKATKKVMLTLDKGDPWVPSPRDIGAQASQHSTCYCSMCRYKPSPPRPPQIIWLDEL